MLVAFLNTISFPSDDPSFRHVLVSTSSSRSAPPPSSPCAPPFTSSAFTLSTRRAGLFSLEWVVYSLFKSSSLPSVVVSSAVSRPLNFNLHSLAYRHNSDAPLGRPGLHRQPQAQLDRTILALRYPFVHRLLRPYSRPFLQVPRHQAHHKMEAHAP